MKKREGRRKLWVDVREGCEEKLEGWMGEGFEGERDG